ncbi:hypothetical protein SISSUDRAFT_303216 [Sistotremastrum suecicum HHB10207 ss-3]|uniref:C3H1-type domain-containing protein n=1 Tax=Sistotremastrum suecicum HHB10207 ss-3 TaxID=1314776 RepID=A0A166G647_9AGAM|nr:hypothetical protein SISSUDRAFT_303216 [Sistotremastrum suecicum HHB10207 ss-3]
MAPGTLYDPSTAPQLRPWLIRTLEPMYAQLAVILRHSDLATRCDADPVVLADYVLALLIHDGPEAELRKMFAKQLEEFLEQESGRFVETLFSALRSKAYLPYSDSSAPPADDAGIPIPIDALVTPTSSKPQRPLKRSLEQVDRSHEGEEDRAPPKGPRKSIDGQFSRHPSHRNNGSNNGSNSWGRGDRNYNGHVNGGQSNGAFGRGGMNGYNGRNGRAQDTAAGGPDQRPICRDYHNKGYCARGALCNYSHGDDAIVPPPMYGPPGAPPVNGAMGVSPMNFLPLMMPWMGAAGTYDPNESVMDMGRSNGDASPQGHFNTSGQSRDGMAVDGADEVIQDLTPVGGPVRFPPARKHAQAAHPLPLPLPMPMPMPMAMQPPPFIEPISDETNGFNHNNGLNPNGRPWRGRGGHRGGTFHGENPSFGSRSVSGEDKTLVVERIPAENLSLESVNGFFKQFGTVTNVAIDSKTAKALVSFSTHLEAQNARNSKEAIFGNRFVKVFWHKPMEGQGQRGVKALEASAPVVQGLGTELPPADEKPAQPAQPAQPAASTSKAPSAAEAKARMKALEAIIAEGRVLASRLKTAQGEERKTIEARMKVLLDQQSNPHPKLPPPTATPPRAASHPPATPAKSTEALRLERLDKELDLQQAVQELTRRVQDPNEDADAIREELSRLSAKAAAEGIGLGGEDGDEPMQETPSYPSRGSYRPYRARGRGFTGRGRSFYRGAAMAGPPRNMKLDNRPKRLLVKGVALGDEQALQHVREWYLTSGQLDSPQQQPNGDIILSFQTRSAAEQAFAASTHIKSHVNDIKITWHSDTSQNNTSLPPPPSTSTVIEAESVDHPMESSLDDGSHGDEGGWGHGDD